MVQAEAHHLNLLARALPVSVARVHRDIEVVFGGGWDGAVEPGVRINQVTTSTFAGGTPASSPGRPRWRRG